MRQRYTNIAVVGAQFGDEGKARIVNAFAHDYKYIVRWSGSENAGHTLFYNGKKIVRHLIPSADFSTDNIAVLGSGMVINPVSLLREVKETEEMFPGATKKIIVDPDAFVITEKHVEEDRDNIKRIGSTGKGVSPAYRDKIYRTGVKFADLIKDNNEIILALKDLGVQFKYNLEMFKEFANSSVLFEGAQSVLLDMNFGIYPYVTSGECTPAGIFNAGFSYAMPARVFGISKCYATRVGEGPFPTELSGQEAESLREKGCEYGATTGRPRRIGWLDLPLINYACKRGGITDLVLTKLDILNGMDKIKVCIGYENEIKCGQDFRDAKPIYREISGWKNSKSDKELYEFLDLIEDGTDCLVTHISDGTGENDIRKY